MTSTIILFQLISIWAAIARGTGTCYLWKENVKYVPDAERCSAISMYVINLLLHMLLKNEEKKVEYWYRFKIDSLNIIFICLNPLAESKALNVEIMPSHMLDGWKASRVPWIAGEPTDNIPLHLSAD